jgi:hypothetical protein
MKFSKKTAIALTAGTFGIALAHSAIGAAREPGKIGLVLSYFNVAMYETKDGKEECPKGTALGDPEQFHATFPGAKEEEALLRKTGHRSNRGRDGANAYWNPLSLEDPVPHHLVEGKRGFGLNLDGIEDGRATEKTCKHDEFVSPTGETGIDNQLYRLIGCGEVYRTGGLIPSLKEREMTRDANRWLIEITGVDNEKNDDRVEVFFTLGSDPIQWDANMHAVAWTTQHAIKNSKYEARTIGKIVDGVVITEPLATMKLPFQSILPDWRELVVRDARMHIKLTPTGAESIIGGYLEVQRWWRDFARMGAQISSTRLSAPNMYREMLRIADGYKDPATGVCTAMSAGYQANWARAFVIHDDGNAGASSNDRKIARGN